MVAGRVEGMDDMGSVTCHISMSLDGFVAGPNQSVDNPLGEGGMRLHDDPTLQPVKVIASPRVTHVRYDVVH